MALFRYKNSKNWWLEIQFEGQVIRESTKTPSKKLAREAELRRRITLRESYNRVERREKPQLLCNAAEAFVKSKTLTVSASTTRVERDNLKHLLPVLGQKFVCDIKAADINSYQQNRVREGASPSTINLEVGTLRSILRKHKIWPLIQPDVRMLKTRDDHGRALTSEEQTALLRACAESRSRSLYPAVVLALGTGMRYSDIRLLRWKQVDFAGATVVVGSSKTANGTGRTIPLNRWALDNLMLWATQFPSRDPDHFIFPAEKYGASGDQFTACAYDTNPTVPIRSWKVAWKNAKKKAGAILGMNGPTEAGVPNKAGVAQDEPKPLVCRFHDMRHTACTRMLEGGVPYPVLASLMGWSAATAIRMSKRYGHIGQKAYRDAVELLNGQTVVDPLEKPLERNSSRPERIQ